MIFHYSVLYRITAGTAVTPELRSRIGQLSLTQLEDLGEALLDFSSQVDLVTWLQGISDESVASDSNNS